MRRGLEPEVRLGLVGPEPSGADHINLDVDPLEHKPFNYPHIHTWVIAHAARIAGEFNDSLKREQPIPVGAPLDFVPTHSQ
ncbi:hypothetical protein CLV78_103399 [Aliiruegeria haliotis]|uniref:Uncharacterized protein n=1 Tax=Aliiruegeria haliotis TaxID=1280846 RepID=A0A2T0RTN9_9RHOB|nr:hypothetical protein CLV78_103399 [Aliiruegeria haliotis]